MYIALAEHRILRITTDDKQYIAVLPYLRATKTARPLAGPQFANHRLSTEHNIMHTQ